MSVTRCVSVAAHAKCRSGTLCAWSAHFVMSPAKPSVVIVDDDPDTVEFLVVFLTSMGIDAVACPPDGHLDACIAHHQPRLLILDVQMGSMNGIDLFRDLRADSATRTLPVIFFTGSDCDLRTRLPDFHAQGAVLVAKPNVEQLSARVQDILNQHA